MLPAVSEHSESRFSRFCESIVQVKHSVWSSCDEMLITVDSPSWSMKNEWRINKSHFLSFLFQIWIFPSQITKNASQAHQIYLFIRKQKNE